MELKLIFNNNVEVVVKLSDEHVFSIVKNSTQHMICIDNKNFDFELSKKYDDIIKQYGQDIDPLNPYIIEKIVLLKNGNQTELNWAYSINYEYSSHKECETIFFQKKE